MGKTQKNQTARWALATSGIVQDVPYLSMVPMGEKTVTYTAFNTFLDLAPLQEEWDSFVDANGSDIFMTYDWCRVWWKHYGSGRELVVFIFREKGDIVGMLPMFLETIGFGGTALRVAKLLGSDYTFFQFSLAIKRNFKQPVLEALCEDLHRRRCDLVYLGPISGIGSDQEEVNIDRNYKLRVKTVFKQNFFTLSPDQDEQFCKMTESDRKDIKRSYARLRKLTGIPDSEIDCVFADEGNFEEMFGIFAQTHQLNWRMKGQGGHFTDWPKSLDFHREVAREQLAKGRLRLLKITAAGICLGYEYDYWFGNKCFEILSSRNSSGMLGSISTGKINYWEKIKILIRNDIKVLDSMRGAYEYKQNLGADSCWISSILFLGRSPASTVKILIATVVAKILQTVYYRLWFVRIRRFVTVPKQFRKCWMRVCFLVN